MASMLIGLKKIHASMFKVLKSIYIFESTNRFIYEHICIDLSASHVFMSYCVIFSLVVGLIDNIAITFCWKNKTLCVSRNISYKWRETNIFQVYYVVFLTDFD